VFIVLVIV